MQTAEIIHASMPAASLAAVPGPRERHLGALQGLLYSEAATTHPDAHAVLRAGAAGEAIPGGGESEVAFHARAQAFVVGLAAAEAGAMSLRVRFASFRMHAANDWLQMSSRSYGRYQCDCLMHLVGCADAADPANEHSTFTVGAVPSCSRDRLCGRWETARSRTILRHSTRTRSNALPPSTVTQGATRTQHTTITGSWPTATTTTHGTAGGATVAASPPTVVGTTSVPHQRCAAPVHRACVETLACTRRNLALGCKIHAVADPTWRERGVDGDDARGSRTCWRVTYTEYFAVLMFRNGRWAAL